MALAMARAQERCRRALWYRRREWGRECVLQLTNMMLHCAVVSASDGQLPRLACRTCAKRFHRACLYKWFRSSAKSMCPHCQSPW